METAPQISTLPPPLKSQDFSFLRSEGLTIIQALASGSWTDHNLHDPGITLLEAMCYAVTEAGLRTGMDMKDLLASSGTVRSPEFFTASRVLPTAPVTAVDVRKVLINHPQVRNAWAFPQKSLPLGRYSVLLEFEQESLNSNNLTVVVTVPGIPPRDYTIDIAFPHWDDEDVLPMLQGAVLQSVVFEPGNEWKQMEGDTSFFARATVNYTFPSDVTLLKMNLWIVAQITTEMEDVALEAPGVLAQLTTLISDLGPNRPLPKLYAHVLEAHAAMRHIRRYILPYRSLGESIATFNAVRQQEVGITATIEVGSDVNVEELLAEMFFRVSNLIATGIHFSTLDEQLQLAGSADVVFDGPLTDAGFLANEDIGAQQITSILYTSDILRIIYQLRNAGAGDDVDRREDVSARKIIGVRGLSLANYMDNRPITTKARDCLQLVKSQKHIPVLSVTKSQIIIFRNGVKVAYNIVRVLEIFNNKKEADIQASASTAMDIAVPQGEVYPIAEYYPIQNDLPLAYGVGEAGLPDHATIARRAQSKQLKGYLFLFEQLLAGYQAQLSQFNTFFSADPEVSQTIFQQPLYHLPDIAPLYKAFGPQYATWQDFVDDQENEYAKILEQAAETREQFLQRRNALLDHLLAALGEDMRDRTNLLLRLAMQVPGAESMNLIQLLAAQQQRRMNTLQELIYDKSAFYYALPELNQNKPQAYGHPMWHTTHFMTITPVNNGFAWEISNLRGVPVLKEFELASSRKEALQAAELALKFATNASHYTFRLDGPNHILEILSTDGVTRLAESVDSYPSLPEAEDGMAEIADMIRFVWSAYTLIPLEYRLYHMLGIDLKERRPLIHTFGDYVEIYDEPVPNAENRKRFRLRDAPGPAGILLESAGNYPGVTNPEAIAAARAAAQLMIDQGTELVNYVMEDAGGGTFRIALKLADNTILARSPNVFLTVAAAKSHIRRIREHIFRMLSAQGFFLVEHHLLFSDTADENDLLQIPGQTDPHSFQITFVFPSGYERDFAVVDSPPVPSSPALYRDNEFRKYAEEQVRKHCPAHILPRVLWVDRAVAGTDFNLDPPCIEEFELVYFNWLRTYLTDEVDPVELDTAREALVQVMNNLYSEYFTT